MLCQIGTVVDVIPSMRINLLSGFALAAAAALTPAQALTIPPTGSSSASIFSRDATSQFGRNGYAVGMDRSDDGDLGTHASAQAQAQATPGVDPAPLVAPEAPQTGGQRAVALAFSPQTFANLLQTPTSNPGSNGLSGVTTGDAGGPGSTTVGTVPLPSTLPLFGAALLVVAALGRSRRKRVA